MNPFAVIYHAIIEELRSIKKGLSESWGSLVYSAYADRLHSQGWHLGEHDTRQVYTTSKDYVNAGCRLCYKNSPEQSILFDHTNGDPKNNYYKKGEFGVLFDTGSFAKVVKVEVKAYPIWGPLYYGHLEDDRVVVFKNWRVDS